MEYTNIGTFLGHFIIFIKRLSGEINETANYFTICFAEDGEIIADVLMEF
jgi:hypothetical protein